MLALALPVMPAVVAVAEAWDAGAMVVVARRVPLGKTMEIEPALAWDSLYHQEAMIHRASATVNLPKEDWH